MVEEDILEAVEYDWAKIRELIDIVDLLRGHPNLKPIADAAMVELNAIANPPQEEPVEEIEEEPTGEPTDETEKDPEDE